MTYLRNQIRKFSLPRSPCSHPCFSQLCSTFPLREFTPQLHHRLWNAVKVSGSREFIPSFQRKGKGKTSSTFASKETDCVSIFPSQREECPSVPCYILLICHFLPFSCRLYTICSLSSHSKCIIKSSDHQSRNKLLPKELAVLPNLYLMQLPFR